MRPTVHVCFDISLPILEYDLHITMCIERGVDIMFSSNRELSEKLGHTLNRALTEYNSGMALYYRLYITDEDCHQAAKDIMDVFEKCSISKQLDSFPVHESQFPQGFDWTDAIEGGILREKQIWIEYGNCGLVENFILPAMVEDGFIVKD